MSDTEYEGSIPLSNYEGKRAGTVAVHSSHGSMQIQLAAYAEVATANTVASLAPDEARELAGALKRAADATEAAQAFVEGYRNGQAA